MVKPEQSRFRTFTTSIAQFCQDFINVKGENEALNCARDEVQSVKLNALVRIAAIEKKRDLAAADASFWKSKYFGLLKQREDELDRALAARKSLRDIRSAASRKGWQTRRAK